MPWRPFRSRKRQARERAEEIRAHLDLYTDELIARGYTPDAARREARLKFGNPRVKLEEVEAMNRIPLLETLGRDFRSAVRGLRGTPGTTLALLAVITLVMGATTAVFSVVDAVIFRRLPFPDAQRLVAVDRNVQGDIVATYFAATDFLQMRALTDVFDGLAAVRSGDVVLRRDGDLTPEVLRGQRVTSEFFPVLRMAPALGRTFTSEHEVAGRESVAVISHAVWQRRFGGAVDVIGRRLPTMNGSLEVIAVMPQGFSYPVGSSASTEVWTPNVFSESERRKGTGTSVRMVARLKDGVALEQAQARVGMTVGDSKGWGAPVLRSLHESLTGSEHSWMVLLAASVACLLLIASVNIATLLLVRATVRTHELSVRSALGATRLDLARLLLVESLTLSACGLVLGAALAWWGVQALVAVLPSHFPRLADIAVDGRVLLVSAAMALATGLASGLAPAVHSSRAIDQTLRRSSGTSSPDAGRQRLRGALLVIQVALAVVLLVGAALFLASFARVMRIDLGLDYEDVMTVEVRPTGGQGQAGAESLTRLIERVRAIPGVQSAAIVTENRPFRLSSTSVPVSIPGRRDPTAKDGWSSWGMELSAVSADYFRLLNMRLRRGRFLTAADDRGSAPVVVLNEAAAKEFFPAEDPVGQLIEVGGPKPRTVVGVVGDIRNQGPQFEIESQAFVPLAQGHAEGGTLFIKTTARPSALTAQVNAAIWTEFPDVAIPRPGTLEQALSIFIAERRTNMFLLSLFGLLGVSIAAAGIYGVMAYTVSLRTREIGIRRALGAPSRDILRSVIGRATLQVAAGLLVGLSVAWFLATLLQTFLFGVDVHEVPLYAAGASVLIVSALAAAYSPARRASRVDPLVALRLE
jgi:predicted permease